MIEKTFNLDLESRIKNNLFIEISEYKNGVEVHFYYDGVELDMSPLFLSEEYNSDAFKLLITYDSHGKSQSIKIIIGGKR